MGKRPISATIEEDLVKWLEEKCKDKQRFRNKSHLIEVALESLRKDKENYEKETIPEVQKSDSELEETVKSLRKTLNSTKAGLMLYASTSKQGGSCLKIFYRINI